MPIFVETVEMPHTTFPQCPEWDIELLSPGRASELTVVSLGTPSGRHPVDLCPKFEREWQQHAPRVFEVIASEHQVGFLWVAGPMESCGLCDVFPYMTDYKADANRFYIPETMFLDADGFRWNWLSFEYSMRTFVELIRDEDMDLETTRISALFFDEKHVASVACNRFDDIGLSWILDTDSIAVSFHRHCEGVYVLGKPARVQRIVNAIRTCEAG